ncbi:Rieske (2Fe-2S) protein [Stutzerimonas zhaodongensis]|uniref:Rieske (2Fe-2S) protein n=1 Tax=Stutzerimonas zhaodongensis TaxID=1176257 RepID=A0A3M2HI45_9GAMM|nr:Rieske (2Fe-2S) protein [Stutzerimonas zhaodongensis]MCQ4318590.1 Rieske (2Fe-2S) protein [Stutzerimonas zhaodongensis]RMH88065.1 Rieske (2Fe-2S) protein [Stutzerimonas zhaodongensis]
MIRLCNGTDVAEGTSKGFQLDGQSLLAVRKDGTLHVYLNRCPHRGIPLEWLPDQFLDSSGSLIQCATHGALFLIESGECVAGPCAGAYLRPVPSIERDGIIWLQNPE